MGLFTLNIHVNRDVLIYFIKIKLKQIFNFKFKKKNFRNFLYYLISQKNGEIINFYLKKILFNFEISKNSNLLLKFLINYAKIGWLYALTFASFLSRYYF